MRNIVRSMISPIALVELDRRWPGAHSTARFARAVIGSVLMTAIFGVQAQAQNTIGVEGNVLLSSDGGATFYADNPFTTNVNEGIPPSGNVVTGSQLGNQLLFEGRQDTKGTATIADDENINFDIYVGQTSYGLLSITSGLELRDMDLIIGDQDEIPSGQLRRGTGYVLIEGPGSLYNNDPSILPFFPTNVVPAGESPSINDRVDEPGATDGFDLWVGRAGNGTLAIGLGGRAEIQDAVIVGDQSASVGTLTIDGVGSFLQNGDFEIDGTADDEVHYMIVGRLGSGTMSITNGGQSFNLGPAATAGGGGDNVFGAVVGSNFAATDSNAPGAGGQGTVYVDGISSKWTIGGNLQIGGFHDKRDGIGPNSPEDLEGNDLQYNTNVGRGTLNVSNGALVSIVPPPLEDDSSNVPDRLDMLVGRFGRVNLAGGRIELLGAFDINDPENPTQELIRGRLINDGVIAGSGRISVLQFRNRVLGEVRVGAGEKLIVDASGGFLPIDNLPVSNGPEYPLSNYGLIEALGTETARAEVEFERGPGTPVNPIELTRPFLNLQVPITPGANGRTEGLILGQDSILRFRSGINNFADLSFTGGTNVVTGTVRNEIGGTVFVAGNGTTVTFEDRVENFGHFSLEPNISLIIVNNDFMMGGTAGLSTSFGGRPTGQEISHLSASGDISLNGILNASLFTSPGVPTFSPQPGDQFEILSAAGELTGNFTQAILPPCVNMTCFVGFPDYAQDVYFIRTFSTAGSVGADFDNSGLVDALDLAIWQQNLGGAGPAGDANSDGIVNGIDFFIWQMQVGGPGMGAGSGSGAEFGMGTVPEPTSLALWICGGLLALAWQRRSHQSQNTR